MTEHGFVIIKLYLQTQMASKIWPCSKDSLYWDTLLYFKKSPYIGMCNIILLHENL